MCEYSLLKTRIKIDQDKYALNQDEIKYQKLNQDFNRIVNRNVGILGGGVLELIVIKKYYLGLLCKMLIKT